MISTDEDRAYCAMQWVSGMKQREIAVIMGQGNSTYVCNAIAKFVADWSDAPLSHGHVYYEDNGRPAPYGEARKPWARKAVHRFVAARPGYVDQTRWTGVSDVRGTQPAEFQ
jgi:hypothetical protein